MKHLPKQFPGRGEVSRYDFIQLRHTDNAFLYEVSSGDRKHYEVFKKKLNHRFACVSYPSSKAFGIWAWTYMSLERALEKFEKLNADD